MTLTKNIFLTLSLFAAGTLQAQTYHQKLTAVANKVNFSVGPHISELDKAESISQIYELIFESSASHYFSKSNGLVRDIILDRAPALVDETLTRIRGNTLVYPTRNNVVEQVLEQLPLEQEIASALPVALRNLKKTLPNLTVESEDNVLFNAPNANFSRLQILQDINSFLETSPELTQKIRSLRSFKFIDSTDYDNKAQLHVDSSRHGTLKLARVSGISSELFVNNETLELMFQTVFVRGFNIRSGYFTTSNNFSDALLNLNDYLDQSQASNRLKNHGVKGFIFDKYYDQRREIFEGGSVYVGFELEDIARVVEVFFP